jgi:hypothetical protein
MSSRFLYVILAQQIKINAPYIHCTRQENKVLLNLFISHVCPCSIHSVIRFLKEIDLGGGAPFPRFSDKEEPYGVY